MSKETDHFYKDLSAGPAWFGRACKACKLKRYRDKKRPVPGNTPAPHHGGPFKFVSVRFKKYLYVSKSVSRKMWYRGVYNFRWCVGNRVVSRPCGLVDLKGAM